MNTTESPEISIVTPVFNEAPNLEILHSEILIAMETVGRSYEVIAVDDGSSDGSFEILKQIHEKDNRWRIVRLARNFGQSPAMYAGFTHVRGRIVITIDADLQNPPSDIGKLLEGLESGYDVVQGWRESRQDNLFRKWASKGFNKVVSWLTRMPIKDMGSGIKAYRREVTDRMLLSEHKSRYIPAEVAWLGVKLGEVKVDHRNRAAGKSKYNIFDLLRVNFDMITSISTAPVQIIGMLGGTFSLVGFAMAIRIGYMRIMHGNFSEMATVSALFFFLGGVQMICTSILCEYISRIYVEVQRRPYYIVGETIE